MARSLPLGASLVLLLAACASSGGRAGADRAGSATFPNAARSSPSVTAALPAGPSTSTSALGPSPSTAAAPPPTDLGRPDLSVVAVSLTEVGRFDEPVALVGRQGVLYVAEKAGRVLALTEGGPIEVLDMTDRTESAGERGLLGMAFSPDDAKLYVSYTNNDGDSRIDEYALRDGAGVATAEPDTRREVLAIDQPYGNHNGGHLVFGPDGYLYAGYGDGGSAGDPERRGLDPRTLLGKLLRIDPRPEGDQPYTVPADNPFASAPGGVRPEIWSYGLRNPWRFSFDPATGDLWVGDVGQNAVEEIDRVPADRGAGRGTNFGWSAFEGTDRYNEDQDAPDQWPPLFEYRHEDGGCSVTGGVVYRGAAIPALRGAYLFADYCLPGVAALVADGNQVTQSARLTEEPGQVVSFGTDAAGNVYVVSVGGRVYRIDPA